MSPLVEVYVFDPREDARHPGRHRPHRGANDLARQRPARRAGRAWPRAFGSSPRDAVEFSRREDALLDRHFLEGGEPPLVVARDVLRSWKALRRPPESLLGVAEHRNAHERGREHVPFPRLMEDRFVGLDRDGTEPFPHAAHIEDCCVHRLLSFQSCPRCGRTSTMTGSRSTPLPLLRSSGPSRTERTPASG